MLVKQMNTLQIHKKKKSKFYIRGKTEAIHPMFYDAYRNMPTYSGLSKLVMYTSKRNISSNRNDDLSVRLDFRAHLHLSD